MKAGWKDETLGGIFEIGSSKRVLQKQWQREGVPFYRAREIVKLAKEGSVENDLFISEDHFAELKDKHGVPSSGDLMVSAVGTLGACYVVQPDDRFYFKDASVLRFHPKVDVDSRFYQYAFQWDGLLDTVKKSDGATVGTLTISRAKGIPVPLPPLEEQQRIVAVLDEAFEGLARARAHAEANLQNARELFESYLANVFGEGAWQEKTLDQISENLDRVRVPITKSKRVAGDIPYYGASGVVDHVADYLFDEDLLLISEDGANLLARTYPIAFSISGKSWVNNHAHVLRFDDPDTQEFVRLYLNSISLEPYVSGMAQPKLNQKQLNRIPIPFPDDDMRTEIVSRAQAMSEETQRLARNFEAALRDLDDLRQSLLQKAFAGELT
ncbi:restriction endonuclease subunit S [Leisingera sp. NJS204]|uniref:restriction endonuclease subunit S n=1 Tax=Leisingera sp. NJS204 TaxID=2508307 RepID=UPI0010132217|nr:restriction endonuclease subunit S [Leisingera sp. NJS204]QAX31068.1 restriction endonuclease subunit S [Leisingera sp. NJS204]